jgi:hypothetical protein
MAWNSGFLSGKMWRERMVGRFSLSKIRHPVKNTVGV